MSDELGDDACGLQCTDKSGHIVSHHWQYPGEDGQACDDADMRLVAVTPCCSNITIELSPDVALYQSDVAREYVPIYKFSAERHIYQHKYIYLCLCW